MRQTVLGNMTESRDDLVVGKRYYFDIMKDISGIFTGINKKGILIFKDIQGSGYYPNDDGTISFSFSENFIEY